MLQVGCASASSGRDVLELVARAAAERAARRGQDERVDLVRRAALEALEGGGVLAVDRQQPPSAPRLRGEREVAGGDEALLVREREVDAALERPERDRQARRSRRRRSARRPARRARAARSGRRRPASAARARRSASLPDAAATSSRSGMRLDDLDRLTADRARRTDQRDSLHGDSMTSGIEVSLFFVRGADLLWISWLRSPRGGGWVHRSAPNATRPNRPRPCRTRGSRRTPRSRRRAARRSGRARRRGPPSRWPLSFTPMSRLTSDSNRSPSGAATAIASPSRTPARSRGTRAASS